MTEVTIQRMMMGRAFLCATRVGQSTHESVIARNAHRIQRTRDRDCSEPRALPHARVV